MRLSAKLAISLLCTALSMTSIAAHAQIDSGTRPAAETSADRAKRIQLAQQLLEVDGTIEQVNQVRAGMMPALEQAMREEDSFRQLPAADQTKLLELMDDEFQNNLMPQILALIPDYYADSMTTQQLQDTVNAFQTPALKAYVSAHAHMSDALQGRAADVAQQCARRAVQRFIAWKQAKST